MNLVRRYTLFLFAALVVVLSGLVFFYYWQKIEVINLWWFAGAFSFFFVIAAGAFGYLVVRPMGRILRQIKLLLTGRPYQRIYTDRTDEIGVISYFFNEVTQNIENVSGQLKEGKKMESDLETASKIQRDVLPDETPNITGLDIVAKTRFADDLGGDCFGFIERGSEHLMYVGDVTGHGVPAALVMMMVSTLLATFAEMGQSAYEVVVNTNKQLKPRIKATMFMTMVLLSWDALKQKMTYVGAGHEYLFIYRKASGQVEKLKTGGIALGMIPDNSALVKEIDLELNVGDVVLLFSDGITEARNDADEMFGEDRLEQSFKDYAPQYESSGVMFHIAKDFAEFTGNHEQEDDMTMICIRYAGGAGTAKLDNSTSWAE